MTTRARISDDDLHFFEDLIALANRIERNAHAIEVDLDIDTRRYHRRRFTDIINSAAKQKQRLIDRMEAEKTAAREARQ